MIKLKIDPFFVNDALITEFNNATDETLNDYRKRWLKYLSAIVLTLGFFGSLLVVFFTYKQQSRNTPLSLFLVFVLSLALSMLIGIVILYRCVMSFVFVNPDMTGIRYFRMIKKWEAFPYTVGNPVPKQFRYFFEHSPYKHYLVLCDTYMHMKELIDKYGYVVDVDIIAKELLCKTDKTADGYAIEKINSLPIKKYYVSDEKQKESQFILKNNYYLFLCVNSSDCNNDDKCEE